MFFLIVLLFVFFIWFLLVLSYVEIEIEKFKFNSNYKKDKKVEDYLIYMRFKFLNKITWMKLVYKKNKQHKIFNHKTVNKIIDFKDILKIKHLKYLNPRVQKIDLSVKVDVLDTVTTSLVVGIISVVLSIILANRIENYNDKDYNYLITPIYGEKPQILISLNCIFNVRMVHIINIIYVVKKECKNNE